MRLRGNDGCVGRDDDNEGFVGWAFGVYASELVGGAHPTKIMLG